MTNEQQNITDRLYRIQPGEKIVYWRGYLAKQLDEAGEGAGAAYAQHKNGRAHLVQRRLGEFDYEYIAIGRPYRPRL